MAMRIYMRDITERKRAEEALHESEQKFMKLFQGNAAAIALTRLRDRRIIEVNERWQELFGFSREDVIDGIVNKIKLWKHPEEQMRAIHDLEMHGAFRNREFEFFRKNGEVWTGLMSSEVIQLQGEGFILTSLVDITERKRAEAELRASRRFLEIANQHIEINQLLQEFVKETKNLTNCAAVGIRLLEESGSIPYTAYLGFSQEFYEKESPLSIKTDNCMCINVVSGTTDSSLSFYTEYGSFYINGTTKFLATVSEEEKGKTRNVCNAVGYESVALIPIHSGTRIFGLIHLADYRENMVPLEMVKQLEQATPALGVSIQRILAEEALRESEQLWATTLASIGDAVISTDIEGRITFMNAEAEALTGWTLAEASAKPVTEVFSIINENTRREVDNPVTRVLQEGIVVGLANHTILLRKNGKEIPIDDSGAPIRDGGGKTMGVVLVFRDITERKNAEEALQKAHDELEARVQERTAELSEANKTLLAEIEERKRAEQETQEAHTYAENIVETLHESLVVLDTELQVKIANQTFYKAFKVAPEETEGKLIYELGNHQWDIPELRKLLEEIIPKDTQFYDFEVDHEFPNIGRKTMLLNARRLYQESNISETILLAIEDITERKQAEEKIREQAALLDNAQEAIGVRSLEHRLIYWNKGAERLYGWTAEEALGKNPVDFLFKDNEEPPQLIEAKRIVLEQGEWIGELRQVTKDGRGVIVESRWTLIYDNEGKPKSILIINTDITEKKMFEAHLLRVQRMESIGTLAGGIAHDLNNMLTPMMMSLQMLKEKFKDEQSQKLLTILEKNSQRSADLIKQVLSFSRGVEGERNPLQVVHIITEIEKIAKETFPRNIEIRTDIQKDLFTISGDVTQLHQVIMNLCVNARDAMPDGGILKITASDFFIDENYVQIHAEAKVGSYVTIAVSDTGIGIPPKILDRIFEPFFTTKEFGKGTGLGLSTALAIVKSHSGFINVYSEVGTGTTFRVYLPAIKTEMQNAEEQPLELLVGQGEPVLVAEDEDSVREVTVSTLEKYGYYVLSANDGADAVALYAQNKNKVEVILMDMMMPVMDGHASIKAIRKINPEVKIIAVSGLAEKEKLKNVADYTNAFLPKPYTAERLLKTIHEVLYGK
jgi:two-component system cell cycle sensor histidine kinase/response regulator CckA